MSIKFFKFQILNFVWIDNETNFQCDFDQNWSWKTELGSRMISKLELEFCCKLFRLKNSKLMNNCKSRIRRWEKTNWFPNHVYFLCWALRKIENSHWASLTAVALFLRRRLDFFLAFLRRRSLRLERRFLYFLSFSSRSFSISGPTLCENWNFGCNRQNQLIHLIESF